MATSIMLIGVGMLFFVVPPWIGYLNQKKLQHTDLMAGDEGDD